jgi:hypothetical protein
VFQPHAIIGKAITGTFNSFARAFKFLEIVEISCSLFPPPLPFLQRSLIANNHNNNSFRAARTKRLALALKSIDSDGVSSINKGAFSKFFNLSTQLFPFVFSFQLPGTQFSEDKPFQTKSNGLLMYRCHL